MPEIAATSRLLHHAQGHDPRRVHSRYVRRVADLPCSGRAVRIGIVTRRFRCDIPACPQRIFAERFETAVLPARARRTARLDVLVHHLGLALGGRPAASFARHLGLPVSNDTLLRLVRRRAQVPSEPLKVVGIDDWAFRCQTAFKADPVLEWAPRAGQLGRNELTW